MARAGTTNSIAFVSEKSRERAIELVRAGKAVSFISLAMGLGRNSLGRMLTHIEENLIHADFSTLRSDDQIAVTWYKRFAEARAEEGMALEAKVATGGAEWKRDAWLLERRHAYAYGDQSKLELTGADGGPVSVSAAIVQLPARDLEAESGPSDDVSEEPGE